ncbi:hypothetical protein ACFX2I_038596 [Malus domestica]
MDCPFAAEVLRILPLVVARTACPLLDAIDFEDERMMNDERLLQGSSGLDLELVEVPSNGRWGLILKVRLMKNEENFLDLSGFAWELWSFKASRFWCEVN